jgi:putative transcriptional regulator
MAKLGSASNITNTIRRLRFDNNEMTQEQLAKAVGVTRQTILALEANKYTPSLDLAFRIARLFNKNIEEVFCYED